jgi:tetratricopeptide (TPR) repeat protein
MIKPPQLFILAISFTASSTFLAGMTGCAHRSQTDPYAPMTEASRDPRKADELNLRAADQIQSNPAQAESLLRQALAADLYHGPAHNNLGVLYLGQGKLYEAAAEFEWARRLMPGHPDPRINLGSVYEKAGRHDDALASYQSALDAYPEHLQATQTLVRLQVRTGKRDSTTRDRLADLALRGETPEWRDWAKAQLLRSDSNAIQSR